MRTLRYILLIFLITGLGLALGGGYWAWSTSRFIASASTADGRITELVRSRSDDSITYRPVVEFTTADGRKVEFVSTMGSNPPSYTVGEAAQVYYDPARPESARLGGLFDLWFGPLLFAGMGVVFVGVGAVPLVMMRLRVRRAQALRATGMPIAARFQGVERNTSLTVNGRNPYRLVCQWHDAATGKVFVFHSDNIWFDPSDFVKREELTVFVEPGNYSRHWVDTSFLPEAGRHG